MAYAIDDARTAGFDVGEDLSVTDRFRGGSRVLRAARQTQAEALAGDIRQRATRLGLDQEVAGKITSAMAQVRDAFPHDPSPGTPPKDSHVHAVDHHTFKQDPSPPPPPPMSRERAARA